MDIKITSITTEIMKTALAQAHEGRQFLLDKMAETIAEPRAELNENAPRIQAFKINPDKIRDVIGTGGKVIREIVEKTGAKVDIEDDGSVRIAAVDQAAGKAAYDWIQGIVAEPEKGKNYLGTVCKIMEFGAFVTFLGKTDGLVHISEMAPYRVGKVTDLVKEGDKVWVKCLGSDNRGKIRLSMKCVDQTTGETIEVPEEPKKEHKKHHEKKAEETPVIEQTGEDLAGIFGDK
jgi:polyribonucleotide nucleotidyltransferase